jgi:phenylacetate-CoA ligase
VASIESFQALVPTITKRDVFAGHPLAHLLVTGSFDDVETLIASSGHTAQSLSLGMIGRTGVKSMVRAIDELLQYWFNVRASKTFLINTCSMGVKIPTSLRSIDLSVRSDKAIAIAHALAPYFRQFVVTSDVYFLKKLLEDAGPSGWPQRRTHFVIGGEWFPETYRSYLAHLLQVDLDGAHPSSFILSSMGAAELGFNLCFETHETVRLRRLAAADPRLCRALFGTVDTVPMIGYYDPRRWFVELESTPEIAGDGGAFIFTNVDPDSAMPLIRYKTGDCGFLLSHRRIADVLLECGYKDHLPTLKLPFIAVAGRTGQSLKVGDSLVRTEFLRSLVYSDHGLAAQTTGQFTVQENGQRLRLCIQLRPHIGGLDVGTAQTQFAELINRHVAADVRTLPYFEFRHGMTVDYERKFSHLSSEHDDCPNRL